MQAPATQAATLSRSVENGSAENRKLDDADVGCSSLESGQAEEQIARDGENSEERNQRRKKEYYKPSFYGEPCGPGNRLILEDQIGTGNFSTVFRCRDIGCETRE